jgi:hypothetical protein
LAVEQKDQDAQTITAAAALLGVFLGGVLSFRNQDRLW